MGVMVCEGLFPESDIAGYNLAKVVFANILPTSNPWSVEYSSYGSYFDCTTKIAIDGVEGLLGMVVRFEITEELEVVVTRVTGSRKHSNKSWNGAKYSELREAALRRDVKSWLVDLKAKGVRVLEDAVQLKG